MAHLHSHILILLQVQRQFQEFELLSQWILLKTRDKYEGMVMNVICQINVFSKNACVFLWFYMIDNFIMYSSV